MRQPDNFCSGCAAPLALLVEAGQQRPACPSCGRVVYYDPKIAAIAVVARDERVLMVRRAVATGYGLWSMPGGFVDRGEVVEDAAVREVWEETGLVIRVDRLVGLFSHPGETVVVAAYAAQEVGGKLEAGPESLDLGFFHLDQLPPLAFPRDQQVLARWRELMLGGI